MLWAPEQRGDSVRLSLAASFIFGCQETEGTDRKPWYLQESNVPPSFSSSALGMPGEAPGVTQTPSEPGVPTPNPLGPCDPHTPGKGQGRRQGLLRAPHPHPFVGPACLPASSCLQAVSLLLLSGSLPACHAHVLGRSVLSSMAFPNLVGEITLPQLARPR